MAGSSRLFGLAKRVEMDSHPLRSRNERERKLSFASCKIEHCEIPMHVGVPARRSRGIGRRTEDGGLRTENGELRTENGELEAERGDDPMESGVECQGRKESGKWSIEEG